MIFHLPEVLQNFRSTFAMGEEFTHYHFAGRLLKVATGCFRNIDTCTVSCGLIQRHSNIHGQIWTLPPTAAKPFHLTILLIPLHNALQLPSSQLSNPPHTRVSAKIPQLNPANRPFSRIPARSRNTRTTTSKHTSQI